MTAAEIIGEIRRLPVEEQGEVLKFTRTLEAGRMLSGSELGALAEQLLETQDPTQRAKLRTSMEQGFYGYISVA